MKKTKILGAITAPILSVAAIVPLVTSCKPTEKVVESIKIVGDSYHEIGSSANYCAISNFKTDITDDCTWLSSDQTIATISNGQAKFLTDGVVTFSAIYKTDTTIQNQINVTVGTGTKKKYIDDSATVKAQSITSQQDTELTYTFMSTAIAGTSTEYLTAVVQIDDTDPVITINPKAEVQCDGKEVTLKITYDATGVSKMNEKTKFHVTFTNSDPSNTWAQTITGLSITYTSPFFDSLFEYTGYLFAGQEAEKSNIRVWKIALDESISLDNVQIKDFKTTTEGKIDFEEPYIYKNKTSHSFYVYAPYSTFSAQPGDTIGISLTLSCSTSNETYEQTYLMGLMAANELSLIEDKLSITNGGDFAWCYFKMNLPLGDQETKEYLKTGNHLTVELTQEQSSTEPMYLEVYDWELDAEKDYFTLILNVKEGYIDPVKIPSVKFDIKIHKDDTRIPALLGAAHGSAGWDQTFEDVTLNYDLANGEYLVLDEWETPTEYDETKTGDEFSLWQFWTRSKTTISVDQFDWTINLTLSEVPEDFTPVTTDWSSFATLQKIDATTASDIMADYVCVSAWPDEWQQYITAHGSLPCKWNITYTAKRKIDTTLGITRYQKQIFTIKDALWLSLK